MSLEFTEGQKRDGVSSHAGVYCGKDHIICSKYIASKGLVKGKEGKCN